MECVLDLGKCVSAVTSGVLETLKGPHTLNRVDLPLACMQTSRRGWRVCVRLPKGGGAGDANR